MAFNKKTIRDIKLKAGQRVVLRADFNVPVNDTGQITDTYRIDQTLPTIEYLLASNQAVIIISHLGRPDGKPNPLYSLAPVAKYLESRLEAPLKFVDSCMGENTKMAVENTEAGTVLLLENLRFHPEEENNDAGFAKELAGYGDIFVQDGFGVVHRAHASTEAITHFLPSYAGLLLESEVDKITSVMSDPKRPMLAVVGGAKISDKIQVLEKLIEKADMLAIGGAMANTFLRAKGMQVGKSLYESQALPTANKILKLAEEKQMAGELNFFLPRDGIVSSSSAGDKPIRIVDWGWNNYSEIHAYPKKPRNMDFEIQPDEMLLDIGPASASYIAALASNAKTVVWNGNLGLTETRSHSSTVGPFEHGSHTFLKSIEKHSAPKDQFSLIGGGDTAAYVLGVKGIELPDHISTGGGASLELMGGAKLPGVEALIDK